MSKIIKFESLESEKNELVDIFDHLTELKKSK